MRRDRAIFWLHDLRRKKPPLAIVAASLVGLRRAVGRRLSAGPIEIIADGTVFASVGRDVYGNVRIAGWRPVGICRPMNRLAKRWKFA